MTANGPEGQHNQVSFIRESWLRPPSARFPQDADTDLLPTVGTGFSMRLSGRVRRLTVGLAVLVVVLICSLGYAAVHNANVATQWHQRAVAQVALSQQLDDQLKRANDHITTLDGTVGSLQGQLATATRQAKENSSFGSTLRRLIWPFG